MALKLARGCDHNYAGEAWDLADGPKGSPPSYALNVVNAPDSDQAAMRAKL